MPAAIPYYTVEDLENFPDDGNRYELVDGVLGVQEVWLVDPDEESLARHSPHAAALSVERFEWMPVGVTQPVSIDVGELFRA